jgi:para-nitrobenzyl esterase
MTNNACGSRVKASIAAVLLCIGLPAWGSDSAATRAVVDSGALVGSQSHGVRSFLGIPYAAAPVGERRWRRPQPVSAWQGDRDATEASPACPQPAVQTQGLVPLRQNEDCLNLNVWTPYDAPMPPGLPVMVWIHGGANRIGAGSLPYYDGTALARRGVVVVTINYRLGYLGYFAHPALQQEQANEGGNFALLDQIAALEWVKRNIAGFGGNPGRVTVFGESAGGAAILQLMVTPQAKGLFSQAIVESGGGWAEPATRDALQRKVVAALGRVGVDEAADSGALRALPAQKLVDAQAGDRAMGFGAFLDGVTVTQAAAAAFRAGTQVAVPLLIGSNSWEGSLMQTMDIGEQGRRLANSQAVREVYRKETTDDATRAQLLFGDLVFVAPARWIAAMQSRQSPAWLYRFGYVRDGRRGTVPGTAHGGEVVYVFDTLGGSGFGAPRTELSAADLRMADTTADCWVAFVRIGKPECGFGQWDAYKRGRDNTMQIGIDGSAQTRQGTRLRAGILDAVDKYFAPDHR